MFDGRWRSSVDRCTEPVGKLLVGAGVSANWLTSFGLVAAVLTSVAIGLGHFLLAVPLLILTGLPDLLDGPVARASGTSSVQGAFLDSVFDRVSDAALLIGASWYLATSSSPRLAVLPVAVLAVSFLVSYERAKADSLHIQSRGGLMERAERLIILGLGLVIPGGFVPVLFVMFVLTSLTAIGRFHKIWVQLAHAQTGQNILENTEATEEPLDIGPIAAVKGAPLRSGANPLNPNLSQGAETTTDDRDGVELASTTQPERRWRTGKVESRWRSWREWHYGERRAGLPFRTTGRTTTPASRWRARRRASASNGSAFASWRAKRSQHSGRSRSSR